MNWHSSLQRTWCLAKFELVRLFLTKRGMLALLAFATTWFIILYYPVNSAVDIVYSSSFAEIAKQLFGAFGLAELLTWPVPELAIYWLVAIYSFPVFALIISSDQTCADRNRGTLRFIALRASRAEIIYGRFLGQIIINATLIALTLFATLLMAMYRDASLFDQGLLKAGQLFIDLVIVVLPFIALMSFINSFTKSSRLAIVFSVLFFGLVPVLIGIIEYQFSAAGYLTYIIPGYQIAEMINPKQLQIATYLLPLLQMLSYIVMAHLVMKINSL